MINNLDRIEKLIVDGQKDVVDKISNLDTKIDGVRHELKQEIGAVAKKFDGLDKKFDGLDKKVEMYYKMLDYDIKEVGKKVGEVKDKLDEHIRVPHAA